MLHPRRFLFLFAALVLLPILAAAQDDPADPNDTPLGDVARSLRKKSPPASGVIDDDNLTQVMTQGEAARPEGSAFRYLMTAEANGFRVSAPDVTCSLAFNINAKSLLSSQYSQMLLPPDDLLKLKGPASIQSGALSVSLFNETDWHVSEVAVALTVVKKEGKTDLSDPSVGGDAVAPQTAGAATQPLETHSEKRPDLTIIYKMRAAAVPFTTTVFSAPLNLDLAPGDEWHWAIVQAKGYPPQSYVPSTSQTTAQTQEPAALQPSIPASLLAPQDAPNATPVAPK
jgi:hypothetical protein